MTNPQAPQQNPAPQGGQQAPSQNPAQTGGQQASQGGSVPAVAAYTTKVNATITDLINTQTRIADAETDLTAKQEAYANAVAAEQAKSDAFVADARKKSAEHMEEFRAKAGVPVEAAKDKRSAAVEDMIAKYDEAIAAGYLSPVSATHLGIDKPRRRR